MEALTVEGLRKSYLRATALRDVSLRVDAGQSFGFAGGNGAGKSTFLKCVLNLCHYESGSIRIFGTRARERRARQHIAFLPERFVAPYYLSGRQFLNLILKLHGAAYNEDAARAMLTALDLRPSALAQSARAYSKGMMQKLGLAACFLARRDFYIFDEPMSGLDPKARALVKRQFRALKERGATLFFTSHALADIAEACEQMAILHNGEIRFVGAPAALTAQYAAATLEDAYLLAIENTAEAA